MSFDASGALAPPSWPPVPDSLAHAARASVAAAATAKPLNRLRFIIGVPFLPRDSTRLLGMPMTGSYAGAQHTRRYGYGSGGRGRDGLEIGRAACRGGVERQAGGGC